MKVLLDEMWSPVIARRLRDRGHDVEAVGERPDLRTASDAEIMAVALAEDRIVVTQDARGFLPLALAEVDAGRPYPALILTDKRRWPRENPRTIGRLVNALDALLALRRRGAGRALAGSGGLRGSAVPRTVGNGYVCG